jgi:hypothetical protein
LAKRSRQLRPKRHAPDAVQRVFHAAQHEHREAEEQEQPDHAGLAARRGVQQPVDERVEVLVDLAQRRMMALRRSLRHDLRRGVFDRGDDRALRRIVLLVARAREDEARHREREAEQRAERHQRVIGERGGLLRQAVRDHSMPRRREHAPERLQRSAPATLRERLRRPAGFQETGRRRGLGGGIGLGHGAMLGRGRAPGNLRP